MLLNMTNHGAMDRETQDQEREKLNTGLGKKPQPYNINQLLDRIVVVVVVGNGRSAAGDGDAKGLEHSIIFGFGPPRIIMFFCRVDGSSVMLFSEHVICFSSKVKSSGGRS